MGQGGLDQVEKGVHIILEHERELFSGDIQDAPPDELNGVVVDQDIQRAEAPDRLLHAVLGEGRVFQVAPQQQAFSAQLLDAFSGFPGVLVLVIVGDGRLCPLFCEGVGHRPSNAAVPAGDEGRPAGKPRAGRGAL